MRAKNVDFEVTYVNLREKPDWFLEISPHGKVPVLKVDDEVLFESNAIAEYLDEMVPPRLHPEDPVKRARNRAWTDFVPDFSRALGRVGYAKTPEDIAEAMEALPKPLSRVEEALTKEREGDGPFFNGSGLSLVDAAYAPFLMRFTFVEQYLDTGALDDYPKIGAWRDALLADERIRNSVPEDFEAEFAKNLVRRETHAATLMEGASEAAE